MAGDDGADMRVTGDAWNHQEIEFVGADQTLGAREQRPSVVGLNVVSRDKDCDEVPPVRRLWPQAAVVGHRPCAPTGRV